MILEFLLFFSQLKFFFFFLKKQVEVIEKSGLIIIKTIDIFEYEKNNDKY